MRARIVQVGNARGLRIPKPVLVEMGLELGSEVEIENKAGHLVVTAVRSVREGWAKAFEHAGSDEPALDPHASTKFDEREWSW
jgi:antitoxin MazE